MEAETKKQLKKRKQSSLKEFLLSCAVVFPLVALEGACLYFHQKKIDQELEQRSYVIPSKFYFGLNRPVRDIDNDGKREAIARYDGTNYLFKVGTNGIPYCEPIKGLEREVGK